MIRSAQVYVLDPGSRTMFLIRSARVYVLDSVLDSVMQDYVFDQVSTGLCS